MNRCLARSIRALPALFLLAIPVSGCARVPKLASAPQPVRGASSLEFLSDPANPARKLPPNVQLHAPLPLANLEVPEYPPRPLEARAGAATVGVRFVVNIEGKVVDITRSPLVPSSAGPYEDDFRAAAEAAVRGWNFRPAWVAEFEDGPDRDGDGKADYRVATSIENVPVYLDVRIDFEIVEGKGRVRVAEVGAHP